MDEKRWERRLNRERTARKEAETLLEQKSLELWEANQALSSMADDLKLTVNKRGVDLAKALDEAVEANKSKTEFISMISHEMRTPLNAIIGFSEILADKRRLELLEQDKKDHYSNNILAASKSLLALINDVLDMAKIESGKLDLESISFNHQELLRGLADTYAVIAANKSIDLSLQIDDTIPTFVMGDPNRVSQIVYNLLSNALKFTHSGCVYLCARLIKADSHITVEYEVRDEGIGMSEEAMEKLFSPFVQADSSMNRRYGGTGLGLFICRQLSEAMGGKIWVESEINVGSSFKFHVVYNNSEVILTEQNEEEFVPHLPGMNILLVEDNPVNQELARFLLEDEGANVAIANDGAEGVEMLKNDSYNLVLMDLQMPVCDGYEATRRIREDLGDTSTVIIAMTANASKEIKERCMQLGMNDYLTKPFVVEDLIDKIHDAGINHAVVEQRKTLDDIDCSIIDINQALDGLHGDKILYQRMIDTFIRSYDDGIYDIQAFDCALEKDDMLRLITSLKKLAGNIGASSLPHILKLIEQDLNSGLVDKLSEDIRHCHIEMQKLRTEIDHLQQVGL